MSSRALSQEPLLLLDARAARVMASSVAAGQLGGVAFLLVLAAGAWLSGESALAPLWRIAALFVGPGALRHPTPWTAQLGFLASQLGPALLWALVFGALLARVAPRVAGALPMLLGLGIGLVAELVDVRWVIPLLERALNGEDLWRASVGAAVDGLAHAAFGLTLGAAYLRLGPEHTERGHLAELLRDERGRGIL